MTELTDGIELGLEKHNKIALVTLIEVKGSVPQKIGAKMLVSEEGRFFGTIGGGTIEHLGIKAAQECIKTGKPELKHYLLDDEGEIHNENAIETGMLCGGEAKVFIDILGVKDQAFIFGGGHIAQKLTPILQDLEFHVTIIESREAYARKELSGTDESILIDVEQADNIIIPEGAYVIIVTHSHDIDEQYLEQLLQKYQFDYPWKYIGMIGSKPKVKEIFSRLENHGIDRKLLKTVNSPIGVNLGKTHTPIEIAISIAAQIVKIKTSEEK